MIGCIKYTPFCSAPADKTIAFAPDPRIPGSQFIVLAKVVICHFKHHVIMGNPRQINQVKTTGAMQLRFGKTSLGKRRYRTTAGQTVLSDQGTAWLGAERLRYNFSSGFCQNCRPVNRGTIFSVRFSVNPLFAECLHIRQWFQDLTHIDCQRLTFALVGREFNFTGSKRAELIFYHRP